MDSLRGKTLFITGGSRGIGEAIAIRAAEDGANVVIAAKTDRPHRVLPGTIHTAAEAVEAAGGRALPVVCDIRDDEQVAGAVARAVEVFGGIDILVNNASAIFLRGTLETPMKRYDLMSSVNVRGTFTTSQACLPVLLEAENPHILNLSPPLSMEPRWFAPHVAYTMSKFGMSMCVLGMAEEFRERGVAVNALWPRTIIQTAALAMVSEGIEASNCRSPRIMADAAHAVLTKRARECTGNFFTDEEVLAAEGVTDFDAYALVPGGELIPDFYL
ncbi:MAG: NAD(P)-dependent oxidoreductase [Planctomycetota bacterium]|jgi:citronellol/citronellal dehydrogenase|nr:NAD(P)-dependent oxidoreductase [Planctomycetota bacterium]